jgi:hypothetical protein
MTAGRTDDAAPDMQIIHFLPNPSSFTMEVWRDQRARDGSPKSRANMNLFKRDLPPAQLSLLTPTTRVPRVKQRPAPHDRDRGSKAPRAPETSAMSRNLDKHRLKLHLRTT